MSKFNKDTVYLYGDNCECFGEIDRETLKREWDYFSKFPNILEPYYERGKAAQEKKSYAALMRTLKLV